MAIVLSGSRMRQSGLYSCITVPCRIMHKIMGVRLRFCFLSSLRYSSPDGPTATQARSPNGTTPPLPPPPRPRTPGTVHPRHLHIPPVLYVPELLVTPAHHQVTCITHQRHGTTRLPWSYTLWNSTVGAKSTFIGPLEEHSRALPRAVDGAAESLRRGEAW